MSEYNRIFCGCRVSGEQNGDQEIYSRAENISAREYILLTAVICGATSYAKVEIFGKSKENWLRKYLKLENGIPDACTFRNVIKSIDTQQLHTVFVEWMRNVVEHVTGVVAIDGKQARRTRDAKKPPLHVVSAFSAECSLVLGQLACEEKSNEITAIPKLLFTARVQRREDLREGEGVTER